MDCVCCVEVGCTYDFFCFGNDLVRYCDESDSVATKFPQVQLDYLLGLTVLPQGPSYL